MKFFLILLSLILLPATGCDFKKEANELVEDSKKSYENIVEEAKEVKASIIDAKEKTEETVEDINNAIDAVQGAADAVKEVTR